MSSTFSCDKCDLTFGGSLDTVEYKGIVYDLCAPCRKELENLKQKAEDNFFKEI